MTAGGNALKYYASVRLDVRRVETLKAGGVPVGSHTRVRVVKNKVAPPFKEAEFDVMYGKGISKVGEIVDLGAKFGIIKKSGAWFGYGELRLGQGRDNAKTYLEENPELAAEIEALIRKKLQGTDSGNENTAPAPQVPAAESAAPAKKVSRADIDILVDDDE